MTDISEIEEKLKELIGTDPAMQDKLLEKLSEDLGHSKNALRLALNNLINKLNVEEKVSKDIQKSEDEVELARRKFNEQMERTIMDPLVYTSHKINWIEETSTWEKTKSFNLDVICSTANVVFLAHSKDKIKGKPQLVHPTIQKIPLIKQIEKPIKKKDSSGRYYEDILTQYKFIDDRYDKRYDGNLIKSLPFSFWVYKVVDDGLEVYIFTENQLPNEYCEFEGMQIDVDDTSELTNSLKVGKITTIFICKEAKSFIKVIPQNELIDFVKKSGFTKETFQDFVFCRPDGKVYSYTPDFNLIRIAQLLSGKCEGYPLHLIKFGPVGTGKTFEAEALDFKFKEEQGILEAANSTLKSLVPSFREKPANIGFVCSCNRAAIIDELMKMVEKEISNAHDTKNNVSNYFGQMNFLLEHKDRTVGSGNNNSARVQATAKVFITTNNIQNKNTIYSHLSMVDGTTLSRMLVWVQDAEEITKIYSKTGVKDFKFDDVSHDVKNTEFSEPKSSTRVDGGVGSWVLNRETEKTGTKNKDVKSLSFNEKIKSFSNNFLTIYDSCQPFLINYDEARVKKVYEVAMNLAKEPMRQIWRARGLHHTILILDGITKFRCLFEEDQSFTAKDQDYDDLERLLVHMVRTWDTNFERDSWKEDLSFGSKK